MQRLAELHRDLPRFPLREPCPHQKLCERVALHVFLQHGGLAVLLRRFHDLRQMRAQHWQQTAVDLAAAAVAAEDIARAAFLMPHDADRAAWALLQHAERVVFGCHSLQKALVQRHKFHILCSQHIVFPCQKM